MPATLGLDEALRRGEAFLKAGADILFIESPESEEELAKISKAFRGALTGRQHGEGGLTPIMDRAELERLGFKVAISHRWLPGRRRRDALRLR